MSVRCAFCHGPAPTDAAPCEGCGTLLHADCWSVAGGCPTLGCGRALAPKQRVFAKDAKGGEPAYLIPIALGIAGLVIAVGVVAALMARPAAVVAVSSEAVAEAVPESRPVAPAPRVDPGVDDREEALAHLAVGQVYHYHMDMGAPMDQTFTVTEVTLDHVKYDIRTFMNGRAIGEPSPQTFQLPEPVLDPFTDPGVKVTTETVVIDGFTFDCWVVEASGYKTWSPFHNGRSIFPFYVKQSKGDKVTISLTKIEGPRPLESRRLPPEVACEICEAKVPTIQAFRHRDGRTQTTHFACEPAHLRQLIESRRQAR